MNQPIKTNRLPDGNAWQAAAWKFIESEEITTLIYGNMLRVLPQS